MKFKIKYYKNTLFLNDKNIATSFIQIVHYWINY